MGVLKELLGGESRWRTFGNQAGFGSCGVQPESEVLNGVRVDVAELSRELFRTVAPIERKKRVPAAVAAGERSVVGDHAGSNPEDLLSREGCEERGQEAEGEDFVPLAPDFGRFSRVADLALQAVGDLPGVVEEGGGP
ncbi:hypothetical protein OG442_19045 [Streptomyces niveus]|uniref:Uncharacterized protein n=1 Tax=Streptomyces niveus TaxID=193462 RepID=A0ABZ2A5I1_STRNV|nr:hypothetical protein [Streptomyces niveus]